MQRLSNFTFTFLVACMIITCSSSGFATVTSKNELVFQLPEEVISPKILARLGSHLVTQIGPHFIEIATKDGSLCDSVLYDHIKGNFNFDGLYQAVSDEGVFYFRFGWQRCREDSSRFIFLNWANHNYPKKLGMMKFAAVVMPIHQSGTYEISMVGDSLVWFNQGETWRIRMSKIYPQLRFIGSRTDTFGYGHEGEGGDDSRELLARLNNIIPSHHYLVMIGTNDGFEVEETIGNIKAIAKLLIQKTDKTRVTILTLIPRSDHYDWHVQAVNRKILEWKSSSSLPENLDFYDIGSSFRALPNWRSLLLDGIHPSSLGYQKLSELLAPLFRLK